jgi:triosephosphate isomerase
MNGPTPRYTSKISDKTSTWVVFTLMSWSDARMASVSQAVGSRSDVLSGAQNIHWEPKGAFTGELSIPMVQEAGAKVALIGHSERRHLFGETDEQVARKTVATLKAGMVPLVCLGETLAEREGRAQSTSFCASWPLLDKVPADWAHVVIAYVPVWAIGTGARHPGRRRQARLIRFTVAAAAVPGRVPILRRERRRWKCSPSSPGPARRLLWRASPTQMAGPNWWAWAVP